jgi:thiamine-monophosphate kinase
MPDLTVSQSGERELLKKIFRKRPAPSRGLLVGMGDDAAVVRPKKGRELVYTTDTLVENIDFSLKYFSYRQIGEKAMAANLSDIAAMGAVPIYFLLTLGIPSYTPVKEVMKIFEGLNSLGKTFRTDLIGGDLSEAPFLFVGLSMIGEVKAGKKVLRKGAKPEDLLYVTGTLGDSKAGLEILKKDPSLSGTSSHFKFLTARHLTPSPRVEEGRLLSRLGLATAMIDISDGVTTDLVNLTDASGVGADLFIDELPLSAPLVRFAKRRNKNPCSYALSGGEDFELLFTVSPKNIYRVELLVRTGKIKAKAVGKMTLKKRLRYIDKEGRKIVIKEKGYEHFISRSNE